MRSVPPRGSGWVLNIADSQFPIFDWCVINRAIDNLKSTIGNRSTHPLPRGGTDLMTLQFEF
jgi:hypothetical protein